MSPNLRVHLPTVLSGISLGLAAAVSTWIALLPGYYKGVAVIEEAGKAPLELNGLTASFIEVNGLWGVFVLLIPVFITLVGFLTFLRAVYDTTLRKVSLWMLVVILLLFCALGVFSIGTFYLPSALALLVAAIFRQKSTLENRA